MPETSQPTRDRTALLGVDVGGTFTDAALHIDDVLISAKTPTTADQSEGVLAAVDMVLQAARCSPSEVSRFAHGTTIATNALLERRGARVAFATTQSCVDVLELGRQQRSHMFDLSRPPVSLPVVDGATVAVAERMSAHGVEQAPDNAAIAEVARALSKLDVETVAICLLHSWRDPTHERKLAEAIRASRPDLHVVASHELSREVREYERACTTVLDAYLTPVVRPYLARLAGRSRAAGLPAPLVMQSEGGVDRLESASDHAARVVLSGPAGGLVAAERLAEQLQLDAILCMDVGGTSCDVAVVGAHGISRAGSRLVDRIPLQLPTADIHTVGAGGSSIARLDPAGALTVGPHSAGSHPGPACYGRGGDEPTVTDAHLVLGVLAADSLGRSGMQLDRAAAVEALARLGLGSAEEAAADVVRLATFQMAEAARAVSVARGHDPAGMALLAYGGAGGLHACDVADQLACDLVVVPLAAGVLSAWGIAVAEQRRTRVQSVHAACTPDELPAIVELARRELAALREAVGSSAASRSELTLDLRFRGQAHSLEATVQLSADAEPVPRDFSDAVDHFVAEHRRRYGFILDSDVELVTLRTAAIMQAPAPGLAPTLGAARQHRRRVELANGEAIVVDLPSGSVLVPHGWRIDDERAGCLLLRRSRRRQRRSGAMSRGVRISLLQRQLEGIAEEMGAALVRSALSANIKEREDSSCALFDADGTLLAQAAHIPVHLGSMGHAVAAVVARAPAAGDIWLLNDPYAGGTHLPDITLVAPIDDDAGTRVAFAAVRAHHADVGGAAPGSMAADATSIADEGVRVAPTRVGRGGALCMDTVGTLIAGMRQPEERLGDLRAQAAGLYVAERRVLRLVDSLGGPGAFRRESEEVLDYAARRFHAAIAPLVGHEGLGRRDVELPDGSVATIEVRLAIDSTGIAADLRGSAPQTPTSLNCPVAVTNAAVMFAIRAALDPTLPTSGGVDSRLRLLTREGTIVDAQPPAAVAAGNVEVSSVIVDATFDALSQFVPVPADGQGTMNNVILGNADFSYYETVAGGQGAGPSYDGPNAVQVAMTNTRNTPIEVLELEFPLVVERYQLRRGSGGPGRFTGGDGVVRAHRMLVPCTANVIAQRRVQAPRGRAGGAPGLVGEQFVNGTPVSGLASFDLQAGDVLEVRTPGGGGWGGSATAAARTRVVVYATRRRKRALELLVFDHRNFSDAGTQVPAGGIGQDEDPERAALRELHEETSVVGDQAHKLGRAIETHPDGHVCDNWYFHVAVDDRRTSWTHVVSAGTEDEGLVLECRFLPLGEASKRLHPSQHTFLDALRTRSRRTDAWGQGTDHL